ncbi:MAG TPA: 5'/3'-nucleotidase SurE [Gaiellales bacterium]|nr:5'/3'-nucleotidase SurE [Gaiellales bacterium]
MRILLTNDDGVTSRGLLAAKKALDSVGTVSVIAPDSNRSAVGRGITIHRPLTVVEHTLRDGSTAYATDGTPVDCVRFGALGLLGEPPDLIVAGINYGVNLGDDITYSGTVAAAFEGIVLGIPAVAVSQQSTEAGTHFRRQSGYDFEPAAGFLPGLVSLIGERGLPPRTILNVNVPPPPVTGVSVVRLGRRIYRDRLELESDEQGRRRYHIYGDDPSYHEEPGTDFHAIAESRIAVTPVHLDLTSGAGLDEVGAWPLGPGL